MPTDHTNVITTMKCKRDINSSEGLWLTHKTNADPVRNFETLPFQKMTIVYFYRGRANTIFRILKEIERPISTRSPTNIFTTSEITIVMGNET